MKYFISIILLLSSTSVLSCGYHRVWDGMSFYNLFEQTNISATEFYPFLKDDHNAFYKNSKINHYKLEKYPRGNISFWKEILTDWETKEIEKAVYEFDSFSWKDRRNKIENRTKKYLEFAQKCSEDFRYRNKRHSWNYNEITAKKTVNAKSLLSRANQLLNEETNRQLKLRYYYQIIDIREEELILEEAEKPCKSREKQIKERPLVNISDEDLLNELRHRNYDVDQINTLQKVVNY